MGLAKRVCMCLCCDSPGASSCVCRGGTGRNTNRHYWKGLVFLALCCSGFYLMLYHRATLVNPSILIFPRILHPFRSDLTSPLPSPSLVPVLSSRRRNATVWSSTDALRTAIVDGSALPLLTLFTTWANREDLSLVRNLTLRNWSQLKPFIVPVLFTNDSQLAAQAVLSGWHTMPVTKTAIGVPVLKKMYLDAMKRFNSTLYAFANGDILFTMSLVDSLVTIFGDPSLPLNNKSLLVVGQRVNVPMVTAAEALTFENLTKVAKARGKLFVTMAEDFFITDRRFPWDSVPEVVIGRVAYDNWLVLNAIKRKQVVVDVSKTVLAVHQTTKAGNHEGHKHAHSSYNRNVLQKLHKSIRYAQGRVDCAPWRTVKSLDGKLYVALIKTKPKHC